MPLPITFAILTNPQQLSVIDTQFAAVAALGAIPCTATGTNSLALTPFANTPTISSYPDLQPSFVFVAPQTSTGAVTINVNAVGARNAYKWNGQQACGAGDILQNGIYRATPLLALNAGAGGFVVDAIGVNNNLADIEFQIDGGGSVITTGIKGYLKVPWAGSLVFWTLIADQSGTISVDILRANAAVPTVSMVGGGTKPNLAAAQILGSAPSGWTSTSLAANDWLGFQITGSVTSVTRITVDLAVSKI